MQINDIELPDQVPRLIDDLNLQFWHLWTEETKKFPDIPKADHLAHIVVRSAIMTIMGNYILGFNKERRAGILEDMIESMKHLADKLNNLA